MTYKVTVTVIVTNTLEKVLEAASIDEARALATAEKWQAEGGWRPVASTGSGVIDSVVQISTGP